MTGDGLASTLRACDGRSDLCYVATGALAFVHDQRASLWDIAGAAPVVLEAGGILTAERGTPIFPLDPDGYDGEPIAFLAGDPIAHDESLREVLRAVEAG